MENTKDFKFNIRNWHFKDEVGLPEDGSYCFIVFGNTSKGYLKNYFTVILDWEEW